MVVIISNELDRSTDHVIDWLIYKKAEYMRINREVKIKNIQIEISNERQNFDVEFEDGKKLRNSEISSYWYRKDGIGFPEIKESFFLGKNKNKLISFINTEGVTIKTYIESLIQEKFGIGSFENHRNINKLKVLIVAKQVGFSIPETLVTDQKDVALRQPFKMIIKALSEVFFFNKGGKRRFITYTSRIQNHFFNDLPSIFFPSLFQSEIEKQYELRIFYLNKKCYGMAIFSQNDEKTSVDFRNYNSQKPNRWIPYKVRETFGKKIIEFMEILDFKTGSLDFIVDNNNHVYFLEVNPSGQFGMVSYPCNYYLEKEIATQLINFKQGNNEFE